MSGRFILCSGRVHWIYDRQCCLLHKSSILRRKIYFLKLPLPHNIKPKSAKVRHYCNETLSRRDSHTKNQHFFFFILQFSWTLPEPYIDFVASSSSAPYMYDYLILKAKLKLDKTIKYVVKSFVGRQAAHGLYEHIVHKVLITLINRKLAEFLAIVL